MNKKEEDESVLHYIHSNGAYTDASVATTQTMAIYSDEDDHSMADTFGTISCWFRKTSASAYGTIIKMFGNWSGFAFGFGNEMSSSSSNSSIRILREGIAWDSSNVNITDLNWHQITFTFGTNSYKMYLDGVLKKSVSSTTIRDYPRSGWGEDTGVQYGTNDPPFYGVLRIGGYVPFKTREGNPVEADRLARDIDITRVFVCNDQMSATDIATDFSKGILSKPNTSTHFYSMSKCKGEKILDEVGDWNLDKNMVEIISE